MLLASREEEEGLLYSVSTTPSTSSGEADYPAALEGGKNLESLLQMRRLAPEDLIAVRQLCAIAFPIEYPQSWYEEVVNGSLFSLGIFHRQELAGMIVAEMKSLAQCNPEDRDILHESPSTQVVYILSVAVRVEYRRRGIASRLLKNLLNQVVRAAPSPRCIFLHVLESNAAAISFYKRFGFQYHNTLLNYYRINDRYRDGLTYVLYVNGGRAPSALAEVWRALSAVFCFPIRALLKLRSLLHL